MEILGNKKHTIIHGDALDALTAIAGSSVDLIFAVVLQVVGFVPSEAQTERKFLCNDCNTVHAIL